MAAQKPDPVGFAGFAVTAMDTGQEGLVYLGNPIYSQLKARNVGDQALAKYQTIICVGREEDYLLVAASTLWTVSTMGEVGTDLYPKTDKALLFGRATPDFRRWLQAHLWDLYVYGALKQNLAVDPGITIDGVDISAGNIKKLVHAYLGANQSIPYNIWTKMAFSAEKFDLDNVFDTTNYRYSPGEAGYYRIGGIAVYQTPGDQSRLILCVYINGVSKYWLGDIGASGSRDHGVWGSVVIYLATTDYVELYTLHIAPDGLARTIYGTDVNVASRFYAYGMKFA